MNLESVKEVTTDPNDEEVIGGSARTSRSRPQVRKNISQKHGELSRNSTVSEECSEFVVRSTESDETSLKPNKTQQIIKAQNSIRSDKVLQSRSEKTSQSNRSDNKAQNSDEKSSTKKAQER